MIGKLRGTLAEQDHTELIVDCGGVGYLVTVSTYTMVSLPAVGEPITLRIFTQAQENKIALYGFASALERELFDLLITVKNIGPSSAMGILSSGPSPVELARIIASEQTGQLVKLRGIGKKTAEMLVVELREKCLMLVATWEARGEGGGPARAAGPAAPVQRTKRAPILEEVAHALLQLGWRPVEVDKAVADLSPDSGATLEELLRQALRSMPR